MRTIIAAVIAVCVLLSSVSLAADSAIEPWEGEIKTRIVRIAGYEGVTPLNMFIEPGTVVVWLNQYKGPVRVTFPDKKITLACKSPVGFTLSDEGYFVAEKLELGAVSSLCFIERGTFAYSVERESIPLGPGAGPGTGTFRFEGKIVVQ